MGSDKMLDFLNDAFQHPDKYIGSGERNTEVKICYNLLPYLGWNPITDIAVGFQIQKTRLGEIARTAHAVDFALRDDAGIRLLGEVKHWLVSNSGWRDGLDQIRRYQRAIPVERCFLSCGHRWAILNNQGEVVAEIKEKKNINRLIEQLTPYLGKEAETKPVKESDIWSYGICPSAVIPKGTPNLPEGKYLSWEPDKYEDETIAYRVRALKDFADKYDLIKDIGTTALIVRLTERWKIIEYRPFNPEINASRPKYDLEKLNISDEQIKELGALLKRCRDGKEGFHALLDMLERIVLFYRRN